MANALFSVTKTIVTDTNAYTSGDFMGTGILTLENVRTVDGAYLEAITVTDLDKQSLAIDFLFWSTACTNTTFTNNGALDIHDTDLLTFLGHVSIVATDYAALSDNSVATKLTTLPIHPANTGNTIYCTPVSRGTPTHSASGLQVTFSFNRG